MWKIWTNVSEKRVPSSGPDFEIDEGSVKIRKFYRHVSGYMMLLL
jgi:hypothetical protein